MITRGSYANKPMVNSSGGGGQKFVLCKFLKILMVSEKKIHKAFRVHETLQTKHIREILYFHYLPELYFSFKGEDQ